MSKAVTEMGYLGSSLRSQWNRNSVLGLCPQGSSLDMPEYEYTKMLEDINRIYYSHINNNTNSLFVEI